MSDTIEYYRRQCGYCGEYDEDQAVLEIVGIDFQSKGSLFCQLANKVTGVIESNIIWVCQKCQNKK